MKILAFDTSNQPLSVAVIDEDKILAEQLINVKRNHSIQLMPAIDETLVQANLTMDHIDRIAVAAGPGSYTGLRIAVTIAKSLAWTKKIDLVGISSLKVIAANSFAQAGDLIVPLFDARRRNLYTGIYAYNEMGALETIEDEIHISSDQWIDFLNTKYPNRHIELIGVDAEKFIDAFKETLGDCVHIARPDQNLPRASVLALLAKTAEPVNTHTFTPTYLKLAEAEENWLKEHPDFEGGDWVEKV